MGYSFKLTLKYMAELHKLDNATIYMCELLLSSTYLINIHKRPQFTEKHTKTFVPSSYFIAKLLFRAGAFTSTMHPYNTSIEERESPHR